MAVLAELGWVDSGPIKGKSGQNVFPFASTEDEKIDGNYSTVGPRNLSFQNKCKTIKERATSLWFLEHDKFTGERYEAWLIWSGLEPKPPNNYSSALVQLYSLELRFQPEPNVQELYQQSIDIDDEGRFMKVLGKIGNQRHFRKIMVFATPSNSEPKQAR